MKIRILARAITVTLAGATALVADESLLAELEREAVRELQAERHAGAVAVHRVGPPAASPSVTGLSADTLARSGRLRVFGAGFGGIQGGGGVTFDDVEGLVSSWSENEITVYVPEPAGPGDVDVRVVTDAGVSGSLPLTVTLRHPDEHIRWRFTCDARGMRQAPAVAPDGTVYVQDTDGTVYALSSDGALLWLHHTGGQGGEGPVVLGDDGTIFVGSNPLGLDSQIVAISPQGQELWRYTDTGGQGLIAGPGVGPDGNVYAVFDFGGAGAVSLTPQGDVRWTHPGDPQFWESGQLGQDIAFGADRFYVAFDMQTTSPISLIFGIGFEGDQLWAVGRPNNNARIVVGPGGDLYLPVWGSGSGIRLGAYDADGNFLWQAFESPTNSLRNPDVGPDGSIYVVRNLIQLHSLFPDGSSRWTVVSDESGFMTPAVSPTEDFLLAPGAVSGGDSWFRGYVAATGEELWEQRLPIENGYNVLPYTKPVFSAAGSAYVGAEPSANVEDDLHCYMYAIGMESAGGALFSDGFESGDTAAWGVSSP